MNDVCKHTLNSLKGDHERHYNHLSIVEAELSSHSVGWGQVVASNVLVGRQAGSGSCLSYERCSSLPPRRQHPNVLSATNLKERVRGFYTQVSAWSCDPVGAAV